MEQTDKKIYHLDILYILNKEEYVPYQQSLEKQEKIKNVKQKKTRVTIFIKGKLIKLGGQTSIDKYTELFKKTWFKGFVKQPEGI